MIPSFATFQPYGVTEGTVWAGPVATSNTIELSYSTSKKICIEGLLG